MPSWRTPQACRVDTFVDAPPAFSSPGDCFETSLDTARPKGRAPYSGGKGVYSDMEIRAINS